MTVIEWLWGLSYANQFLVVAGTIFIIVLITAISYEISISKDPKRDERQDELDRQCGR